MKLKNLQIFILFLLAVLSGINSAQACELSNLLVKKGDCVGDKFSVSINFDHKDNSDFFIISGNGKNYGKFSYSKLPVIIDGLVGDCTTDYEFQITDANNTSCHISLDFGKVCCGLPPCHITNLQLEKLPCDSNNRFFVVLNFSHENTSNCFKLKINNNFFGQQFEYSSLPLKIGPLEGDCITNRTFTVIDCNDPNCTATIGMDKVCCNHDCKISNIKIERTPCDSNNMFAAILSFKSQNTGDSFFLKVNDHLFGKFVYGNPYYKVGPFPGDCRTKFNFHIIDAKNTQCTTDTLWGPVCCDSTQLGCHLDDLSIDKTDCNSDDNFYVYINFKSSNTSQCFRIKGNGNYYGEFSYANLPVKLGPFKGDCTTNYEFIVQDCNIDNCSIGKSIGTVCCGNPHCQLDGLEVVKSDCDSDNKFTVQINFAHQNTSSCFHVFQNSNDLGEFKYTDLPITVGPFNGDCHTSYGFLIKDCDNPDCHLEKSLGVVCCPPNEPCKLSNLNINRTDCDPNNQFLVKLNFSNNHSSTGFKVFVAGVHYGDYNYTDLPLILGPFNGDCHTEYAILIKDNDNPDCRLEYNFGLVCCNQQPCKLTELNITAGECDSATGHFFTKIDFNHNNTSGCFKLYVNNDLFGQFNYADLPLTRVGPFNGDCKTVYNFLVKDCNNPDCHTDKSIGPVCCGTPPPPCKVSNLKVSKSDCNGEHKFNLVLNFDHTNNSDCFSVYFNGGNLYGKFPYSSLPLTIGPFLGDCITDYSVVVRDCKDEHCAADYRVGIVCCDSIPPCQLSNLHSERTQCDSNNQFFVYFNFDHSNTSQCFRIKGNGNNYGEFSYASLPIRLGPFKGDCLTNYEFIIQDCLNEHCSLEKNVGIVCCNPNCKLSNLHLEKSDCSSDKQFYVKINFDHDGNSDCFHVSGNGHNYGEFKYAQLPITIGPLLGDCITIYEFGIEDCLKHDCHISGNLEKPVCCDSTNSKFFDILMMRTDCEPDSTFKVKFNFHYRDVSDSFNIFINGRSFGTFGYNQLPVSAGPLLADCKAIYKIRLVDQKDTTVHIDRVIERPCCHPNIEPCKIYDIKASPQNCTGPHEYQLNLFFKYQGTTNLYFDVFDRNGPIGYFPFTKSPDSIIIEHFKQSGRDFDFVKICENDNPQCCAAIEFRTIECDSLVNNPNKFQVNELVVYTNTASNTFSLFSKNEFPNALEIEIFNLEGKQLPVTDLVKQPHEIIFSTNLLTTEMYFIRVKDQNNVKTYKFFHIR